MLNFPGFAGWAPNEDGTYRLDSLDGSSRLATTEELLTAKRAQIIEQINAERDRREQSTFPFAGKLIDSDPVSVQRITVASSTAQMALAAGVPFSLDWSCADNSLLTLDAMGVLGMMQALGTHGLALHMYGRGLKAAVEASEDPESIDILTGWPE
jgi:hypothetical protein